MPVTIKVNGTSNSLVHKGSNGIANSTMPDVCKTPSPGGPVPIPYPIIVSMSRDLANGSKTVKADGGNMIAIKGSEFSRCTGDEPGVAGGVKSSTFMKEAKWILYSFDVKIDGQNACRLADKMTMNHGNTVCLAGVINPPVMAQNLLENLEKCDGGTNILAKAKQANGGKDPTVKVGKVSSGFDAQCDTVTGTISISEESDKCTATESLIFELGNLVRKEEFAKAHSDAASGKLSREDYIRAHERTEYENVKETNKAVNSCKEQWGCKNHNFDLKAFDKAKNFDDYYKNYLSKSHKEHYGKHWDSTFKGIFKSVK